VEESREAQIQGTGAENLHAVGAILLTGGSGASYWDQRNQAEKEQE